jgi:hypothetical protein
VLFFLPLLEGELSKHLNSSKKEDTQESSSDVDDSEEWSRNSEDSKDSDSEYEDSHPQKKKIKAEVNEEAPSTSCPSAIQDQTSKRNTRVYWRLHTGLQYSRCCHGAGAMA